MIRATDLPPATNGAAGRTLLTSARPHRPGWAQLRGLVLRLAHRHEGGVQWIEGSADAGKSHLLALAAEEAALAGALVLAGTGVAGGGLPPLAPLLEALAPAPAARIGGSGEPCRSLRQVEDRLRDLCRVQPVVVVLDDVQHCDALTLLAVRTLTARLAGLPLLWLLAARSHHDVPAVTSLRRDLLTERAASLELTPLPSEAVHLLVRDLLGSKAEQAKPYLPLVGGLPGAVRHLCTLLIAEAGGDRGVRTGGDRVASAVVTRRLEQLTPAAKDLVLVASALDNGAGVGVGHLCRMLGRDEAALLRPLREVLAAEVMRADRELLTFALPSVREAVNATLPVPVRLSVRRRSVGLRLADGTPATALAAEIAEAAEVGDEQAIRVLQTAAGEMAPHAPAVAAAHLRSAMDLSATALPRRMRLAARLVPLLWETGDADRALALARDVLRTPPDPVTHARVCLDLVRAGSHLPVPHGEAHVRRALHHHDVPEPLKDQLLSTALLHRLLAGETGGAVDESLARVRGAHPLGDLTQRTLRSMSAGRHRRWEEALGRSESVPRKVAELDPAHGPALPEVVLSMSWRAALLGLAGAGRAAAELVENGLADSEAGGRPAHLALWRTARARLLLDAGRPSEAARELVAAGSGTQFLGSATASGAVLAITRARIALHTGDDAELESCAALADGFAAGDAAPSRQAGAWITLLLAGHRSAPLTPGQLRDAAAHLRRGFLHTTCWDAGDVVLLAEAALAAGQRAVAAWAVGFAEERARLNPGLPLFAAAAVHARGLFARDAGLLVEAAELHGEARPLLRARALEDAGECAAAGGRTARPHLDEALRLYDACGAERDGRRVRTRVPGPGARPLPAPRTPAPDSVDTKWRGLTKSELSVVRLVARGATNREAAQRLFVSPHTVNTHLRHAFEKLGVHSRVRLAGLYAREVEGEDASA
ncbi:helix-turn-helix transcriptional regulator [Streptomyces sp. NBC_01335]|uniref:helix-turn-helix transcriptional regulator n=1 Tax=Streptomyces sp. NBC_01335 TaxID=2903828 RepID=UPI002E122F96|nr:helix-turn-helix transcriptional regulator [Streptomyces sp. NBC_01335]